MIKNIVAGPFVSIDGGLSKSIYFNNGGLLSGQVRFNPNSQCLETYDGSVWHSIENSNINTYIGLNHDAESAIHWALKKIEDEKKLVERLHKYPALNDAYEKFRVLDILTQEMEK